MLFFVFFVKKTFPDQKAVFRIRQRRNFTFFAGFWFKLISVHPETPVLM